MLLFRKPCTPKLHNQLIVMLKLILSSYLLIIQLNCPFVASLAAKAIPAVDGGPRLSDEVLFEALNLEWPGLEEVQRQVAAQDYKAAKHAFAQYLREREAVHWWFDPHAIDRSVEHDKQKADDALRGRVRVAHYTYTFPDDTIDWRFNATADRDDVAFTKEWQWQLNRMYFWPSMGDTYWATGDEKYAKAWVQQLRSWVNQNPYPPDGEDKSWRTIESGDRMRKYWPQAFHRFLLSPSVTDEDLIWYVKSSVEHARHLRKHLPRGNWLTYTMNGLFTVGAVFPELKKAEEWRRFAIDTMAAEMDRQWYPDGVYTEYSPSYHQTARRHILEIYDKAIQFGYADEVPEDFMQHIERSFDYDLLLRTPDGMMPEINDSYHVKSDLDDASRRFPDRTDYRWFATAGKKGNPPQKSSHAFPYGGLYIMRTGWDTEANVLVFDTGPLGTMHEHQDKLHLMLWAYGREILYDGGGGVYESSKYRAYGIDTYAHNTVLVDGQPQRRSGGKPEDTYSEEPVDGQWESDKAHDYAAANYDGPYASGNERPEHHTERVHFPNHYDSVRYPATHTRRVYFLKPDIFLVHDLLQSADGRPHTYEARWHLASTKTEPVQQHKAVVTTDADQPNLAVIPLYPTGLEVRSASGQEAPEMLGWRITKAGPVPTTTVTHTKMGTDEQFLTLLLPQREGQSCGVKNIEETKTVRVTLEDGRKLQIDTHSGPEKKLRVRVVKADAPH